LRQGERDFTLGGRTHAWHTESMVSRGTHHKVWCAGRMGGGRQTAVTEALPVGEHSSYAAPPRVPRRLSTWRII